MNKEITNKKGIVYRKEGGGNNEGGGDGEGEDRGVF